MTQQTFNIRYIVYSVLLCASMFSCKRDDYISGGSLQTAKVDVSTYDYLQGNNMQLFDTVLAIIDKAGLKDMINQQGVTFYAPTDFCVFNYLNTRTIELQKTDINKKYTLDSLYKYDLQSIADSMKMYIIHDKLTFDRLSKDGAKYESGLAGNTVVVSFEPTQNGGLGYNGAVSTWPQIQYFYQLWQTLPDPFTPEDITSEIGVKTLCKTSGVETTTGILNVLENSHVLFFYGTRE